MQDGDFVKFTATGAEAADPVAVLVHSQLRAMMLSKAYTCLGGAAAIRREHYRLGVYPALTSAEAIDAHAADLTRFVEQFPEQDNPVAVFISVFDGPVRADEAGFETDLWRHLAGIDEVNPRLSDASPAFDPDADPGFVFAGRNFFVVGLHPAASRWARRFAWPTLVFNALSHSSWLHDAGQADRMANRIRERDSRLQGSTNPSSEFPRLSQFSGREVGADWTCPVRTGQSDEY